MEDAKGTPVPDEKKPLDNPSARETPEGQYVSKQKFREALKNTVSLHSGLLRRLTK